MIILAIETSCDDTCIAILKIEHRRFKILSSVVSSQVEVHKKWGGVYPTLAKREHQKNLPAVLKKAQSKANNPKIDLIAVTVGPGLEPCLWVGVNFAKDLAQKLNLSIIPANHIEGHIVANWLCCSGVRPRYNLVAGSNPTTAIKFPAICLIISGGHTQLILMKGIGRYKILGETRDDAAGECFDKTARILGLGYPGGPAIAQQAKKYIGCTYGYIGATYVFLPRPMIYSRDYDFSFSGLKTAVLYNYKKQTLKKQKSKTYIHEMCFEIQQSIIDVLIHKTLKVAKDYQVKTIILGGGVAANQELCKQFKVKIKKEIPNSKLYIPTFNMCTDNAAMIGITAYFNQEKKTKNFENIKVNANLRI